MRKRAENRLENIVAAAVKVFLTKGYQRSQMSDIATAMGVAPGTLYLYVESKEALFDFVIRSALRPELLHDSIQLPIQAPPPEATLKFIKESLKKEGRIESLEQALKVQKPDEPRQLELIVRELFEKAEKSWLVVKLIERSAMDWPELASLWFGRYRLHLIEQLAQYFDRMMSRRLLRTSPDPKATARLVIELVAYFAMHRHSDPFPTPLNEATAEDVVVDAIINAYATPQPKRRTKT
jgi:AcrR family transcriptional regulator